MSGQTPIVGVHTATVAHEQDIVFIDQAGEQTVRRVGHLEERQYLRRHIVVTEVLVGSPEYQPMIPAMEATDVYHLEWRVVPASPAGTVRMPVYVYGGTQ